MTRIIFFYLILALILFSIYVRIAPLRIEKFHQKPSEAPVRNRPNEYRVTSDNAPQYALSAANLMAIVDAVALANPRTKRVAGDVASHFATYISRSLLIGYPDYISVEIVELGPELSALEIYSRSRYGYSDFGVNRTRVISWLIDIESAARAQEQKQ